MEIIKDQHAVELRSVEAVDQSHENGLDWRWLGEVQQRSRITTSGRTRGTAIFVVNSE